MKKIIFFFIIGFYITCVGYTPISPVKFTFKHRFRFVSFDNAIDLSDDVDTRNTFTRHLTSASAQWQPSTHWEVFARVTNEFRYYFHPDDRDFTIHEIFLENLYVQWKTSGKHPLSIKLGRQNIMMGEGFVVMDGHPLDGSRSIYFNAARIDFTLAKKKNLTLFYTYQPDIDDLLPIVNPQDQMMVEQTEEGVGLYYSGQHRSIKLEGYLIHKRVEEKNDKLHSLINTFGGRINAPLTSKLDATVEAAYQMGEYGYVDRSAFGGIFHLDYAFNKSFPLPKTVTFGSILLSGDDPSTPKWEGWDPLFSRWPKWSESYIYTLILEYGGRVAYWSNLGSVYTKFKFPVSKAINLNVSIHHLLTLQDPHSGSLLMHGIGRTRGQLIVTKTSFKVSKRLTGHIVWDTFFPGDFYASSADGYHWFRFELLYQRR